MRLRDCLASSVRDLRRQPLRSALTLMALVISTSLLVTLVTLGLETRAAIVQQLGQDRSVNTIVVSANRTAGGGAYGSNVQLAEQAANVLDDSTVTALAGLAGVYSATPVVSLSQFRQFSVQGYDRSFVARTSAIDPGTTSLFTLAAGPGLRAQEEPQVVLGHGYATALGLAAKPSVLIGRSVRISTQPGYRGQGAKLPPLGATPAEQAAFTSRPTELTARVVGVTTASSNDNLLYLPLGWGHGIASIRQRTPDGIKSQDAISTNGYTSILVQTTDSTQVRAVTRAIDAKGYGTSTRQAQIDQINQLSTVMWLVLGAISLITAVSACLGIVNTMLMTVSEQRYAIGVWRACGAHRSLIAGLFLLQAGLLGLVGGVLGTGIGVWVAGYVNGTIATLLRSQGLTALTIDGASSTFLVTAISLTVCLAVLAGVYPAYRSTRDIQV